MNEFVTTAQAWAEFYDWLRKQPNWATIKRGEKQYLAKTDKAVRDGQAQARRVNKQFEKYGFERYVYADGFIRNS